MTQPTNTFDVYDSIGNREDLADKIWQISPTETPFMSNIGNSAMSAIDTEWQTDELAAPDGSNAAITGDDATAAAIVPTVRVGNLSQISDKVIVVADSNEAIDKAGRGSEIAYQVAQKGKELKRDMETILVGKQGTTAGNATTAQLLGAFESWLETNTSRGAGGSDGGATGSAVTAPTDGTQRPFTESLLKGVIQSMFTEGGNLDMLMCGPFNKTVVSGFTGNATKTKDVDDRRIMAAVDVYVSDFGELQVVPNRFQRDRSALLVDTEMASVGVLRPFKVTPLAKTGDSEKRQMLTEYTLKVNNEAAHGVVADLTTS